MRFILFLRWDRGGDIGGIFLECLFFLFVLLKLCGWYVLLLLWDFVEVLVRIYDCWFVLIKGNILFGWSIWLKLYYIYGGFRRCVEVIVWKEIWLWSILRKLW